MLSCLGFQMKDSQGGAGRWRRRRQDAGRGLPGTPAGHGRAAWAAASGSPAVLPDGPPLQRRPGAYQKGRCGTSPWLRLRAPNAWDAQFGSLIRELDPHRLQPRVYMWQQDPVRACVFSPVSHVTLRGPREAVQTATWTVACQAPLSVGFSRQEYWSGLPCPPAVDLPNPEIKPAPLVTPA